MVKTAQAFDKLYRRGVPLPWNVDGPTPFVRELEQQGQIRGKVLDAGCGTGENALFLAERKHYVVGFDGAPAAIEMARAKAAARELPVDFRVADARDLRGFEGPFDTIVDSGLFHVFDRKADRLHYAASLRRVCGPGSTLHLLAFRADERPRLVGANQLRFRLQRLLTGFGTHGVSEAELREAFSEGWAVDSLTARVDGNHHFYLAQIRCV